MQQLVFPLGAMPVPAFDNFVIGRNDEVVAALRAFAFAKSPECSLYVWGPAGSGKSHLLAAVMALALSSGARVVRLPCELSEPGDADINEDSLVVVDNVDTLNANQQSALFNAYNMVRERSARLIAAGTLPPAQLPLRADVNTRLGWGLIYQLHALSDEEKVAALKQHARARGFELPDDVSTYLLRHGRRDLPWLMAVIDALDQQSLAQHRALTLPLLREVLNELAMISPNDKNSLAGAQ